MENVVYDEFGNRYIIEEKLGAGGQGAVYTLKDYSNLVLKCLTDSNCESIIRDEKKYKKIYNIVLRIKSFDDIDNIAAPIALLKKPWCGYFMRLMENMFAIENLMAPKFKCPIKTSETEDIEQYRSELKHRLYLLKNLAKILCDLAKQNLVYCDLSPKNIFVSQDADYHEVWLIDMDNLTYESAVKNSMRTTGYAAPEVAKGGKNTLRSDWYSFALIAYELLTFGKPFDGKLYRQSADEDGWDSDDSEDYIDIGDKVELGMLPYVNDSNDKSNNMGTGISINELVKGKLLTKKLATLFEKTFSEDGRLDPFSRPTISDWYDTISDSIGLNNNFEKQYNNIDIKHYKLIVRDILCLEHWGNDDISSIEKKDTITRKIYYFSKAKDEKTVKFPLKLFFDDFNKLEVDENGFFLDIDDDYSKIHNINKKIKLRSVKLNRKDDENNKKIFEGYVFYKDVAVKHIIINETR